VAAMFGSAVALGLAVVGALLAALGWFFDLPALLNGLDLGVPAMILGPVGYFVGRSAVGHIDASEGRYGGLGLARSACVIGAVAMAIGAVLTLVWLTFALLAAMGPPPA
jgi:hypothetical protein